MTFAQLSAYLQAYLQTNDPATIGQIPNFLTLAASRINVDLRTALVEQTAVLVPLPSQPLPIGAMAIKLLTVDAEVQPYVTAEALALGETGYSVVAGNILLSTDLSTDHTEMQVVYWSSTEDSLSASLPHLFLHAAAAEAELFQGDTASANEELTLYTADIEKASGWDINSGPISLGGGSRL